MDKLYILYHAMILSLGGLGSLLFGSPNLLFKTLVIFVIIDYVTGYAAAAYEQKLRSKVGFKGILKKITIFAIIAISHSIDKLIGGNLLQSTTTFFYLSNELLSIIENAGRLNVPIPSVIKNAVSLLRQKTGK